MYSTEPGSICLTCGRSPQECLDYVVRAINTLEADIVTDKDGMPRPVLVGCPHYLLAVE